MSEEEVKQFIEDDYRKNGLPKTQQQCCAIAARVNLFANGPCWSDHDRLQRAAGIASGLFGPAFDKAGYGQKAAWIDMCELALMDEQNDWSKRG
jgi:hypothetical protein